MGVEAAAVNHHQQQHHHHQQHHGHYLAGSNECGSLKASALASSPPSATKLSSVGIYRPPAARKALKLSESAIQLATPAACENPNEYNHHPLQQTYHHLQHVTDQPTSAAKTSPTTASERTAAPPFAASETKPPCEASTGKAGEDCDSAKCDNSASSDVLITGNKPAASDATDAIQLSLAGNNNNNDLSYQLHQAPAAATSQGDQTATCTRPARPHRERRPDRAVYIPRARRSQTTPPVTVPQQTTTNVSSSTVGVSSPPVSTVSISAFTTPFSSPPKASKKDRLSQSFGEKDKRPKAKDKPPPPPGASAVVGTSDSTSTICNSVIGNHKTNDFRTNAGSECSSCICFKNRSHSVEESAPAALVDQEIVKLKKQKSEEVPRENATQDCELKTHSKKESRKERSNSSILTELNGSTNPKVVENMNKSNKHRSAKQPAPAVPMIINDKAAPEAVEKIDKDERELRRASQEINRSNRRIIKQTFDSNVLEISEQSSAEKNCAREKSNGQVKQDSAIQVNPEEDDWESMYDDNGDCLNPKLMEELTSAVGKVSIEVPRSDYKLYQSKQAALNEEEFPHVLEVSNFPVEFKTQDLMMLFSQYKESGFDIKWVDDTHALAVFSSSKIAAEVLANGHTFVKLKPLAEATIESRTKARKCSSSLQPYRPRPETCAALARRLVTTALGVRLKTAPEERENERRVLREAKERKLLAAKQREEIWES